MSKLINKILTEANQLISLSTDEVKKELSPLLRKGDSFFSPFSTSPRCGVELTPEHYDNFKAINKKMKDMGWYCSLLKLDDGWEPFNHANLQKAFKQNKMLMIGFSKITTEELPLNKKKFLYHVTASQNVPFIKRSGLKPLSAKKLENHPKRIYCLANKRYTNAMVIQLSDYTKGVKYTLIRIDVSKIPNIIWHQDSYFEYGVFTTEPIPKEALFFETEINILDLL